MRKKTSPPSDESFNPLTFRSRPDVRIFGVPPETGTTARLFVAYQISFGFPPTEYTSEVPSGVKAGSPSAEGDAATRRGSPPEAATMKMSVFSLESGSSVRLLTNAIDFPSGDHAGASSS